jgi:hypothetical protein
MERRWVVGIAVLVLIAVAVALVGGLGSSAKQPPPFSVTDSEVRAECLTGTFVPDPPAVELVQNPPPSNWRSVENLPGATAAEKMAVKVTVKPDEAGEKLTLTGVKIDVISNSRPVGTVAYRACKRHLVGPAVEVDLNGYPAGVMVGSSADLHSSIGAGLHLPKHGEPIHFPWTVNLSRPLNLYLLALGRHCYCRWGARISWRSGDQEGVIHADNGGKKYRIIDGLGIGWHKYSPNGHWIYPGSGGEWLGIE